MAQKWNLTDRICFMVSAAITALAGILLMKFVPCELDEATIKRECISTAEYFLAEQNEKAAYFLCTLLFPVACFIFYSFACALRRNKNRIDSKNNTFGMIADWVFILAVVFGTLITFFAHPCYLDVIFDFNRDKSYSYFPYIISSLLALALLCVAGKVKLKCKINSRLVFYVAAGLSSLFYASTFITTTYYSSYSNFHHFDAYFSPVYKILCGYTPLVDFTSIYGNYGYFLAALLKPFSTHGQLQFSIIISCIILIISLTLSFVFASIIKNKLVAFAGFTATCFVLFFYPRFNDETTSYLQYTPHRVLFPVLILGVAVYICSSGSSFGKKIAKAVGYVLCSLSLIWNLDSGVVSVASFMLFNIYRVLLANRITEKEFWKKAIKELILTGASVVACAALLEIITYIRSGVFVSASDALFGQTMFYGLGFYMLRMPLVHPWLLLVLIYMLALTASIRLIKQVRADNLKPKKYDEIVFLLPIIGMGIFSYYQGRSHDFNFLSIVWPGVVLLCIFLDRSLKISKKRTALNTVWSGMLVVFFAVLCSAMVLNFIYNPWMKQLTNKHIDDSSADYRKVYCAMLDNGLNDKNTDIICLGSDMVYALFENDYTLPLQPRTDWFTWQNVEDAYSYVEKSDSEYLVVDGVTWCFIVDRCGDRFFQEEKMICQIDCGEHFYYIYKK